MRIRLTLRPFLIIWIPLTIFMIRHIQFGVSSKIKIEGFIPVALIVVIVFYIVVKRKAIRMRIIYAKEIEEDKRTAKNKNYYIRRYVALYIVALVVFTYLRFNFEEVVTTLLICGVSWFFAILNENDLANKYGK